MKALVFDMLAVLLLAGFSAAQSESKLTMTGPSVQTLLLGQWSTKIQYEPTKAMPKGGVATGEEKWYAGPGGKSLIEEYRESGVAGDITGHGLIWFDEAAKGYRLVWCESTNPSGCVAPSSAAHWEGEQLVIVDEAEHNGRSTVFREVFADITPTSFRQSLYHGASMDGLRLFATIYATRKTAPK